MVHSSLGTPSVPTPKVNAITHASTTSTLRRTAVLAVCAALLACAAPSVAVAKRAASDRISGVPLSSLPASPVVAPDISARSAMLITGNGRALWSRKTLTRRAMASTTKMMTALVVLELTKPTDIVRVSKKAAHTPYAKGLRAGERITVRKLLELALVGSSNDACVALAEHVGGSTKGFAKLMNAKSTQLGLTDSHWVSSNGLDTKGHYTSARDLSIIARADMENQEFRRIVALHRVSMPAYGSRKAKTIKTTNALIKSEYPGILGVKTGFTNDAKYCFVSWASRGDVTLGTVVLGAPTSSTRFKHTARLLNWGFKHLSVRHTLSASETVGVVPFAASPTLGMPVRPAETTRIAALDVGPAVTRVARLATAAPLPVFAGQRLGSVSVKQGTQVLATVPAIAVADLASVGETLGVVPVGGYADRTVTAFASTATVDVLEYDPLVPVERELELLGSAPSPVQPGDVLGTITYSQGGTTIAVVQAVARESVEAPSLGARVGAWIERSFSPLLGRPAYAAAELGL